MDFQSIIDVAREATEPRAVVEGGKVFAVIPANCKVADLEAYMPAPAYVQASLAAETVEGFAAYFNRFKDGGSMIFASREETRVRGVLDYHWPATEEGGVLIAPRHGAHTISYSPPYSIEWTRWSETDGRAFSQADFARFLEENALDVVDPAAADLHEMARSLSVKKKVRFESGVRLHNGANSLEYVEEADGTTKGNVAVPEKITVGIPVYYGEQPYKIEFWLRYRLEEGRVRFVLEMHRRQYVEDAAFKDVVTKVEALCDGAKAIFAA